MNHSFDLKQLSTLRSFAARLDYCNKHLSVIGKGSSRIAFKLPEQFNGSQAVLKLAFNRKGVAQNTVEADAGWNAYATVAKVFAAAEKHEWVVMELCQNFNIFKFYEIMHLDDEFPITPSKFLEALASRYLVMLRYVPANYDCTWVKTLEQNIQYFREENLNETFVGFMDAMDMFVLDTQPDEAVLQDIPQMVNWGFAERNGEQYPVLLDYGLSDKVW